MKVSEFTRKLRKAGGHIVRHGSEHDKWYSPITGEEFYVPRHGSQELKRGMEKALRKLAGI